MRKDTINVTELVLLIVFCALTSYAGADLAAWNAVVSEDNPLHWYRFDESGAAIAMTMAAVLLTVLSTV